MSCLACIFASPSQWSSVRYLAPDHFEVLARYEDRFGRTIQRGAGIRQLADRGQPFPALLAQPDLAYRAMQARWDEPVLIDPAAWTMPAGAFTHGPGPT